MNQRTRKSPARFLAPLALMVIVIAFLAIVTSNGGSDSATGAGSTSTTQSAQSATQTGTKTSTTKNGASPKKESAGKTYTIQVGDTLGGIADKTGVPLERIQTLNPKLDPHNLVLGQKIKLR